MNYHRSSRQADGPCSGIVYKLLVQPKVWIFLWQAVQNILPIGINLLERGITSGIVCIQCGFITEDDIHILLDCDFSIRAWALLTLGEKWRRIPTLCFRNLFYSIRLQFDHKDIVVFATCCWQIWYARNKCCYKGQCSNGCLLPLNTSFCYGILKSSWYISLNQTIRPHPIS